MSGKMQRNIWLVSLSLALLITLSLGGCGGTASPPTAEEPAAEEPAAEEPVEEEEPVEKDVANWTFMIYLDADNDLETAGIRDFLEMAAVGSSPEVNIVLQMDRIDKENSSFGDWTDTRRFHIQKGDEPDADPIEYMGELNMGDPAVLQDFVEWAVADYPAEKYALVIWNHGGGWRDRMDRMIEETSDAIDRGDTDWGVAKAVCTDDTDGDKLYTREVQMALEDAKKKTKAELDLVGFDACLMGMVEIAYAVRDVADVVVGSEEIEPGDGWPYDPILQQLTEKPTQDAKELAGVIVREYVDFYPSWQPKITQSAVSIDEIDNVVDAIDAFTVAANTEWDHLKEARLGTVQYHPEDSLSFWGVDLWEYADEVSAMVTSVSMKTAADELKIAVDKFVIHEAHSDDMAESHGVAIYFPANKIDFDNDPDHTGYDESNTYMEVDFVQNSQWDNWLQEFYTIDVE